MRHEEAANVFAGYLADYLSSKQIAATPIAARVLRERAEGEKSFEEWWASPERDHDKVVELLSHVKRSDARAGHLILESNRDSYHAGRASLQAEVERLRAENEALGSTLNINKEMLEQSRETGNDLRTKLATMCDEVVRMDEYTQHSISCDLFEPYELYKVLACTCGKNNRPPRVTEILAERAKEQNPPAQNAAQGGEG